MSVCECLVFEIGVGENVTKGWLKLIEQLIKSATNWCQYGTRKNKVWVFDLVQDVCEQGCDQVMIRQWGN